MANKRMFSLSVVDTDRFLEMPISSRLLYYELGMRADDDGFVDNCKKIMTFTGLKEDDLKVLILKQFIIPFESGVIVIKHWRLNNYLQKDRVKPTIYQDELSQLNIDENNVYNLDTICIHREEEKRIEEKSKKNNISDKKQKYGEYQHVLLTDKQFNDLKEQYNNYEDLITYLDEYIEMKGYKAKNHYLAIKKWVVDAVKQHKPTEPKWFNQDIKSEKIILNDEEKRLYERITGSNYQ